MKLAPQRIMHTLLATTLASALTAAPLVGQESDSDALRRLTEENARLRQRLAQYESSTSPAPDSNATPPAASAPSAPGASTAPATGPGTDPSSGDDEEGMVVLSPFEVSTAKDHGYLRTNSATATRVGTEIQKTPMSIAVLSEDFIKDTNIQEIQDVLRYSGSSAGDTRMGILQPATGFTPSGNFSLRGFPIDKRLRNGVPRYIAYNIDNVERIEVIQGPAAIFYGLGYPGGVINYVTKKPRFSSIPTTLSFGYGGNTQRMGTIRMTLDHNQELNDQAAFRIVAGYDNKVGSQRFEFQKGFSVTPSLTLIPFSSGRLRINVEGEYLKQDRNFDDNAWRYDERWFEDYANPRASIVAAANQVAPAAVTSPTDTAGFRNWIRTNIGNWINAVRRESGDNYIPLWTSLERGAYYNDTNGNRVHDKKFNYYGSGSYSRQDVATTQATIELTATDFLDVRYVFTYENADYEENKSAANPQADGTFNVLSGLTKRGYFSEATDHQLDLVFKLDTEAIKNRLLVGGLFRTALAEYTGNSNANLTGAGQFPFFGNLPGVYDKPDEGYVSPVPPALRGTFTNNSQYVRDRNGRILSPVQIYTDYDPAVHPFPDIRRITEVSRGLVDRYKPQKREYYVNYQGTLFKDRLTVMGGYRNDKRLANGGQRVDANPPWYTGGPDMLDHISPDLYAAYGINVGYQLGELNDLGGDSWMAGGSFEITPGINFYATYSRTFIPNNGFLGGGYDETAVRARATSLGLNPDQAIQDLRAAGGETKLKNEEGENMEIGAKFSLFENKIVATASLFRLERGNRRVEDLARQTNEPLNYTGPNNTGSYSRIIRWFSNDAAERTEGIDIEAIWSPLRNYQAVISGSWIWTAETVSDVSVLPTNALYPIVFGARLPYVPEYRFNIFNKYTFAEGSLRGLGIGLGMRYSSDIVTSNRDLNQNPLRGAYQAGDYTVFDANISYPYEVLGYQFNSSLHIANLFNSTYSEGGLNLSPPQSWLVTTTMSF